jgi:hypothetical protein
MCCGCGGCGCGEVSCECTQGVGARASGRPHCRTQHRQGQSAQPACCTAALARTRREVSRSHRSAPRGAAAGAAARDADGSGQAQRRGVAASLAVSADVGPISPAQRHGGRLPAPRPASATARGSNQPLSPGAERCGRHGRGQSGFAGEATGSRGCCAEKASSPLEQGLAPLPD